MNTSDSRTAVPPDVSCEGLVDGTRTLLFLWAIPALFLAALLAILVVSQSAGSAGSGCGGG